MSTKAVAAFLILTWPMWLLAFLPLRESGFPSLVLPISGAGIIRSIFATNAFFYHHILRLVGQEHVATFHAKAAPFYTHYDRASALLAKTPLPVIWAHLTALVSRVRWEQWTDFNLTLLPPYPIGALTVRSLICIIGTLALTWCSPWCGLFRQAIWKSATIRRVVRGTGRLLSGQTSAREAYGKGNLDDEWAHGLYHEDGTSILPPSSSSLKSGKADASGKTKGNSAASKAEDEEKVVRHEDVVYSFSIFENQRWWVGLDWTAALLPRNAQAGPTNPQTRFRHLRPSACQRRRLCSRHRQHLRTPKRLLVERSNGNGSIRMVDRRVSSKTGGFYPTSTVYKGSAKDAAIKSAKEVGDKDALSAAKQGYLGDALNKIRARTNQHHGKGEARDEDALNDVGATVHRLGDGEGAGAGGEEEWDVDADGWQYGDNAWEKMSKKSGMGRYTRRRKWVRRAVLLEVVEYGVHGPSPASPSTSSPVPSKKDDDKEGEKETVDAVEAATPPVSADGDVAAASTTASTTGGGGGGTSGLAAPPSPSAAAGEGRRASLSDRLAKAAQ